MAIFGKRGLDIKVRLMLYEKLTGRGLSKEQIKEIMIEVLPLKLGDGFVKIAGPIAILAGVLFQFLASPELRDACLQIHRIFLGPMDYAVLALQWILFYLAMSLVGFCIAMLVAVSVYISRVSRYL